MIVIDVSIDCLIRVAGCEGMSVRPRHLSLETLQPPDVPWYRSCRVQLMFITAWGYVFYFLLRVDLSLAIICMVRDPDSAAGHDNASNSDNGSMAMASVRPLFELNTVYTVSHGVNCI